MVKGRSPVVQVQIGKNGLTDSVIQQIAKIFEHEERMKISILKSACRDKEEAKQMCEKIVGKLGPNFTYRLIGYVCTMQKWKKGKVLEVK